MKFTLSKAHAESLAVSLLVLPVSGRTLKRGSSLEKIDRALKGTIKAILKREAFTGKAGTHQLIHTHGQIPAEALLLVGTTHKTKGDLSPNALEQLRRAAASAAQTANKIKAKTLAFDLGAWPRDKADKSKGAERVRALVEGMELGVYRFTDYVKVKKDEQPSLSQVQILSREGTSTGRRAIRDGQAVARGTKLARDLINTPAGDLSPRELGRRARKVGPGIRVRIYSKTEIERMKMGSYLSVSQGSTKDPALIHMTYKPKGRSKKSYAIVGKGVTFDSGGLSLKPPNSMETMKDDMAGGAAAIGLMQTLAEIKPSVTVHAIVAATENMPSGSATKPGDIARAMNGKTIEILNTDAEGRLTLADALQFAIKHKPDVVIDLATLTGACLVALGERCSGLMGNDSRLLDKIKRAAERAGEMVWPLPLIEEYREDLKSPIADLKNIGGRWGGTIEAGLFLEEFVDKGTRWAHLDIAGPSWANKELPYCPKGGTGCMVNTLTHLILGD